MVMSQGTPSPVFATGQPLSQNPVGTSTPPPILDVALLGLCTVSADLQRMGAGTLGP